MDKTIKRLVECPKGTFKFETFEEHTTNSKGEELIFSYSTCPAMLEGTKHSHRKCNGFTHLGVQCPYANPAN